jgi:hypothetical protein
MRSGVSSREEGRRFTLVPAGEAYVVEAPLDAVVPTFMSFGMSQQMAELYREMYEAFIAGRLAWEGTGERMRGSIGVKEGLRAMLG